MSSRVACPRQEHSGIPVTYEDVPTPPYGYLPKRGYYKIRATADKLGLNNVESRFGYIEKMSAIANKINFKHFTLVEMRKLDSLFNSRKIRTHIK
jgi:hypothetical protein